MYLIDSADPKAIRSIEKTYNILGVTTNPSLLAKASQNDVLAHLKTIREITEGKRLYIQITALDYETMFKEASRLKLEIDAPLTIKIPATEAGYRLMKTLRHDTDIAATAVSSFHQALMAMSCGAGTIIIYIERLIKSGQNPVTLIKNLRQIIDRDYPGTIIMAASLQSKTNAADVLRAGAHRLTLKPEVMPKFFKSKFTDENTENFAKDFKKTFRKKTIIG